MTETTQTFPGEPVATEICRLKAHVRPLLVAQQKTLFEKLFSNLSEEERKIMDAAGGFDAFLESPDGEVAQVTLEISCISTALIVYLEAENKRRSGWEARVEARLNGEVIT